MTLNVFRFTGLNSSLALKAPVRVGTTVNITLAGFQTIDGVLLQSSDSNLRVLVKNQTDSRQNGIYDAQSGNWARSADWDSNDDFVQATEVRVAQGATQLGWWTLTTSDPITLGTSNITFASIGATLFPDGSAASPGINFAAEPTTGFYRIGASQIGVSLGGALAVSFAGNGLIFGSAGDLFLTRAAAAKLQLGATDSASPIAQTLQAQSVVGGTNNTAGATFTIGGSKSTGSASGGALQMAVALAGAPGLAQNALVNIWNIAGTGHTLWNTDSTYDIGASGANRPRNIYVAGTVFTQTIQSSGALQFQVVGANSVWQISSSAHLITNSDNVNDIGASGANRPRNIYAGTLMQTPALRIDQAPTAVTSAGATISSAADGANNLGHRVSININGTTYWFPCGQTAF